MLVQECHYTNVDEHIIDALIFGSSDPRVQSKLLEYDVTLTLNKTIDIARTAEATTSQLADIKNTDETTNSLTHSKPEIPSFAKQQLQVCRNCGTKHDQSQRSLCPAFNSECRKCHKLHHWERVCRSKKPLKIKIKDRGKDIQQKIIFKENLIKYIC